TVGERADLEGHRDALAEVVTGAAHLGQVPAGAEIARAHLRARFEPAAREDDGLALDLDLAALMLRANADDRALVVGHERKRGCVVIDLDSFPLARLVLVLDESGAAAPGFRNEAAPEFESAAGDLVRLAAV